MFVVVIALALLPRFLDVNHYRPHIQAELQNRLVGGLVGNIKASFLPPSLIVKDVVIGGRSILWCGTVRKGGGTGCPRGVDPAAAQRLTGEVAAAD